MTEYTDQIVIFIISGLSGMLYAYCWKWVEMPQHVPLLTYLFGDFKATLKVLLVFISTCVGAVGLEYLDSLSIFQTIVAGCGLGLLIPQKVIDHKEKENV